MHVVSFSKMIRSYRDLIVWQKAIELVVVVYGYTAHFPSSEQYGLVSQMRRSAVSIPTNIAEGRKFSSMAEFRRYLTIAYGSGAELETQIEIAKKLKFAPNEVFIKASGLLEEVMKMLNKFIASVSSPT